MTTIVRDSADDVAILTERTEIGGHPLPAGHKIAGHAIAPGAPVLEHGHLIGHATHPNVGATSST